MPQLSERTPLQPHITHPPAPHTPPRTSHTSATAPHTPTPHITHRPAPHTPTSHLTHRCYHTSHTAPHLTHPPRTSHTRPHLTHRCYHTSHTHPAPHTPPRTSHTTPHLAGITTILTTTTIALTGRQGLAKVSYSTALDWFLLVSFCFVFAALVEYAGVNYFTKSKNSLSPGADDDGEGVSHAY